jgi:hypothetical protein
MNNIQSLQTIPVAARQKSWSGIDFGATEKRLKSHRNQLR